MIAVTRLDKHLMYLNPDHIICIEETPDTVITLYNGNRYIVVDRASAIIGRVVAFRARISRRALLPSARRYLGRSHSRHISWSSQEHETDTLQDSHSTRSHTPLHSQDY
ncbi:MAG: flagellar FlbD family protein [Desulfuromonadaceae bacterium]|nr:flagellar FlbD family protein [Desulfuromonadaceae bacterium]MDD5105978.1 flagellar FlbD family protein [Desulfuromonadaceae bacterium]